MHTKEARGVGETGERLAGLPVWAETGFFTDAERAAFTFAEAMVRMHVDHVPVAVFDALGEHFDEDEIAALVAVVVTVSAWNAIGVSLRPWQPGSYEA